MEAETPRRWIRRPEVRPPDGDADGVTELDAGAEIDVGNGRPTGAERRTWKKAETPAAELGRQYGAAELKLTEIGAGSGVGDGHRNKGWRRP